MRSLIAALAISLAFMTPVLAETTPTISVSGQGEVSVTPDMAHIAIGVTHEAKAAQEAMDRLAADLTAITERLENAGVADKDMQTSGLRLDIVQNYSSTTNTPRITGYMARSQIAIVVRNLQDLGPILDTVVADGANQISNLQFDVVDRKPHLTRARQAAVADAQQKAETIALAAGTSLGSIQAIREGGSVSPPMPMMDMRASIESADMPISEGEITIRAQVEMTYILIP